MNIQPRKERVKQLVETYNLKYDSLKRRISNYGLLLVNN